MRFFLTFMIGVCICAAAGLADMTRAEKGVFSREMQPLLALTKLTSESAKLLEPGVTAIQKYGAGLIEAPVAISAAQQSLDATNELVEKLKAHSAQISFSPVQDAEISKNLSDIENTFQKFPETYVQFRQHLSNSITAISTGDSAAFRTALVGIAALSSNQLKFENALLSSELPLINKDSPQHGLQRAFILGNQIGISFFEVQSEDQAETLRLVRALPKKARKLVARMQESIAEGKEKLAYLRDLPDTDKINTFAGGIGDIALVHQLEQAWAKQFMIETSIALFYAEAVEALARLVEGGARPGDQERLFQMDAEFAVLNAQRVAANAERLNVMTALQDPKL